MLLLAPADLPSWALEACASTPHPAALLRTGERIEPAFLLRFPFILDPAEVLPPQEKNELVLVSLDYSWIPWAKGKRLRAIWLNPQGNPCPAVHPLHDLEFRNLAELNTALRFHLPDLDEALEILRGHGVPENVVRHSAVVAAVAHFLGERLRGKGVSVDPLVAHRGALLHDLDKIDSIQENCAHGVKGAARLVELGYPALAEIARTHVMRPGSLPRTWEEKLVFYADKVVEEDRVVGLERRLRALRKRYPSFVAEIQAGEPFLRALENEFLRALDLSGVELLRELQALPVDLPRVFR